MRKSKRIKAELARIKTYREAVALLGTASARVWAETYATNRWQASVGRVAIGRPHIGAPPIEKPVMKTAGLNLTPTQLTWATAHAKVANCTVSMVFRYAAELALRLSPEELRQAAPPFGAREMHVVSIAKIRPEAFDELARRYRSVSEVVRAAINIAMLDPTKLELPPSTPPAYALKDFYPPDYEAPEAKKPLPKRSK